MIDIGKQAPQFTLKDQYGKTVKLDRFKGKKVLLSFRPLAWTPICHDQMKTLDQYYDALESHNAIAFGVGVDSIPSNKAWASSMGISKLRILSDFWPHGLVSDTYGVFNHAEGISERANILIDESQVVIFTKTYPKHQLPDIEEIIQFLDNPAKIYPT